MAISHVSEELWEEFHTVVNMTSRELADWLRAASSGESTEPTPDEAGPPVGQHVLHILGKRRTDLTEEDVATMAHVVEVVRRERGIELEPTAGDDEWRRRLLSLGHDPLKPAGGNP